MASAVDSKKSPGPAKDRPQHQSNWLTRLRNKNTNTNGREKIMMLQEEEAINSAMPPNHSYIEERTNKTKKEKNKRDQQREKKFLNKAKAKVEREPTVSQRTREKFFFSKMGFRKEKVTIQIQRKLVPPSSKFQSAAKGDMEVAEMVKLYREQYHRHDRPLPLRRVKENINHIMPVHYHQEGACNEVLYASENSKESMQWAPKILQQVQNQREEANNNTHDKYGDESACCSSSNGVRNRDGSNRSNSDDDDSDSDSDSDSDDSDTRNLSLYENSTLVSSITMPRALRIPTGTHLIQSLGACFSNVSQAISSSITCACLDVNGYRQLDPKPVESFDTFMDDLIDRVQVIEVMSKDAKILNEGSTIEKKGKCNYKSDSCENIFVIASDNSATVSATSSF